tara:strand:- start:1016 stop:1210 length:195 start_codon:yes stop_codon:yes gene_type:complete
MEFIKNGNIYKIDKNIFLNEENYIKICWETINNLKNETQESFDKSLRNSYIKFNKEKLNCKYNY